MNNERANNMKVNNMKVNNKGMTLPELVLAILMLTAFTGVSVIIVQYTSRFFQPLNEKPKEEYISSNQELQDILNVHLDINKAFDYIINFFSEPKLKQSFGVSLLPYQIMC